METSSDTTQARKLAYLRTHEIERNPHNPRVIFDPEPMAILKESIEKVGILVPILVYEKRKIDPRKPEVKYTILDGERRWLCAEEIEKELVQRHEKQREVLVPANIIAEPTTIQNILTMFNIHQVREPWELTPAALKLEVVMRHLDTQDTDELAKLTRLSPSRVRQCQILLEFDKKYLDMSLREKTRRITGDFFVQMYPVLELIKKQYPKLYKRVGRNGIIDKMVQKYEDGEITAVTEFRQFANIIRAQDLGAPRARIREIVEDLITTSAPIAPAFKQEAREYLQAEKVRLAADRLMRSLNRLQIDKLSKNSPLFPSLRKLRNRIDKILENRP
jgi:hypothetical protein